MKEVTGKNHKNNLSPINSDKTDPNRNHPSSFINSKGQKSSSFSSYNINIFIPDKNFK